MFEISNEKIGTYLNTLISDRFKSTSDFCKEYLRLVHNSTEFPNNALENIKNRFSQITNGKKSIQVYDLPVVSAILGVSCDEILSAGKRYVPTANRITNYDIAQSEDPAVWEEYMKREDRLFLNCDEYCKSVIDYALEFKNYKFIKWLLDEGFIWFVDKSQPEFGVYCFKADTKIKPNRDRFNSPDQFMWLELREQDALRTRIVALAIENDDISILDSMRARDIPYLHEINIFGNIDKCFFSDQRNEALIEAIANTDNTKILDYFSDEFTIQDRGGKEHTVMFPFLNDVIELLLEKGKNEAAAVMLRNAVAHNKTTFEKTEAMISAAVKEEYGIIEAKKEEIIKEAYHNGVSLADLRIKFKTEEEVMRDVRKQFKYDEKNSIATFFSGKIGVATNIFKLNYSGKQSEIKALTNELNESYNKVLSCGGDKYAEILL